MPKIQGFWPKTSRKNPESAGDLPRLVLVTFRHTYNTKILGVGAPSARSWDFLNTDTRNFDLHRGLQPYRRVFSKMTRLQVSASAQLKKCFFDDSCSAHCATVAGFVPLVEHFFRFSLSFYAFLAIFFIFCSFWSILTPNFRHVCARFPYFTPILNIYGCTLSNVHTFRAYLR